MYVGVDFLLDAEGTLYLSEVNTGVPAGATEFDLAHRARKGRPSDVFSRIESISQEVYGRSFRRHIHSLPWMDDLRALKIWMDGQGPPSGSIHPALRLEDKWVQYHLLSPRLPLIPSRLVGQDSFVQMKARLAQGLKLVIKRRMTRGGRGLRIIDRPEQLAIAESTTPEYIWQPFVASRLRSHAFSLRAAAFAGRFICMFASLAPGDTSNHGIRFFIVPGERLGLRKTDYPTRKVVGPAWEADIFYRGQVPEYLRRDVFEEHIAETELSLPEGVIRKVRSYSARVSRLYSELEFENLPRSYIEETGFSQDRNDGA